MIEFWKSLTTDQKTDIIKVLIPAISVLLGAMISLYTFSRTKKKEINFKIHEQRKIKYEQYLILIKKVFTKVDEINKGEMPIDKEEWYDIQLGIALYGSNIVFKKLNELTNPEQDSNPIDLVFKLGDLIKVMRKEVGLNNRNLSIRECLSSIVTDIHDPKYDKEYKRYLKSKNIFYRIYKKARGFLNVKSSERKVEAKINK